jgi:protein involved in polysaccharide export with SLBB domain/capsular polysaccharide biosynthesis protein
MIEEEFTEDLYTLRKRPRTDHQRSDSRNGKPSSNGHATSAGEDQEASEPQPRSKRRERYERRWRERPHRQVRGRAFPDTDPRRALPFPEMEAPEPGFKFPFDPLRLIAAVRRRWKWVAGMTGGLAAIGLIIGMILVPYSVSVNLLRRDSPNSLRSETAQDQFRPREYSDQTLLAFMKSGEVLARAANRARTNRILNPLNLTPGDLAKSIFVKPSANPDWMTVSVKGLTHLPAMAELANVYASEVADFTKDLQRRESSEMDDFLQKKLSGEDLQLEKATELLGGFAPTRGGNFEKETDNDLQRLSTYTERLETKTTELDALGEKIKAKESELKNQTPTNTKLQAARERLQELRTVKGYTLNHPDVQLQLKTIQELERQQNATPPTATAPDSNPLLMGSATYLQLSDLRGQKAGLLKEIEGLQKVIDGLTKKLSASTETGVKYAMHKAKLDSLKSARESLVKQQRDAQLYKDNALGYFKVFNQVSARDINYKSRWIKIFGLVAFCGMVGLMLSMFTVLVAEALDTSLKTAEDVTRVTKLPVLATLGDLRKMSPAAQVNWAFRTLTILRGKLKVAQNRALVCGIISSTHGEGRSTWVNLLVSAASQRGLRVLTVDTRPSSTAPSTFAKAAKPETPKPEPAVAKTDAQPETQSSAMVAVEEQPINEPNMTLTSSVLMSPAKITEQLTDPNSQPVVHIPLPGWVWNLERRRQWKQALEHWRKIENLVIFVELPPACQAESVLLAENLPQLLWLAGSGMADSSETAQQIETLRHADCNLVGAVLNFEPPPIFNTRITRWFGKFAALTLIASSMVVHADEAAANRAAMQRKAHVRSVLQLRREMQGSEIAQEETKKEEPAPSKPIEPEKKQSVAKIADTNKEQPVETVITQEPSKKQTFAQARSPRAASTSPATVQVKSPREMEQRSFETETPRQVTKRLSARERIQAAEMDILPSRTEQIEPEAPPPAKIKLAVKESAAKEKIERPSKLRADASPAPPPPRSRKISSTKKQEKSAMGAAPAAEVKTKTSDSEEKPVQVAFSATTQKRRAAWQEKLTLGPGDVVDIHLFGNAALTRTNVFVGPDGRLSYLQAHGLEVTGLTIEELRDRLDKELAQYYTVPRTIVVPVAFTSKKYYMLGKVAGKGVYVMDRPLTIIEAVARAKGLETGLYQRNSVEMADLGHSFMIRNGERLPVNFEKLFLDGDLSQNVVIEPNDYIYFASAAANDIYVLGEIMNPGPIGFVPDASVVTVITDRGGFAERAYKKKVLVVRGSLAEPETFAVDVNGILEGRQRDFKLQPHDIVFVARRPWSKVEEVADDAAAAFIEGATTTWVGGNIRPIIKHRLLPAIGH